MHLVLVYQRALLLRLQLDLPGQLIARVIAVNAGLAQRQFRLAVGFL